MILELPGITRISGGPPSGGSPHQMAAQNDVARSIRYHMAIDSSACMNTRDHLVLTTYASAAMRDVRTTTGHRARPPRIGSRQPDSSLVGGALRCSARPPHRPLPRARCAVGAPACPRGRARCRCRRCGTRSGRAHNTAPFRSRAHASRRYRRARYPTRAGSEPA